MKCEAIGNLVGKTAQCQPEKLGREFFSYLDISSVDRETKQIVAAQLVPINQAPSRARKLIRAEDVLISTVRPNLNAVALVPKKYDGEIASTGFCVLRPRARLLEARYLFYFAQTPTFVTHLTTTATGANYPAVSDDDVLEMLIPLPDSFEGQQRIAGILEQADRLRRIRRYALELGDRFLPAAFLRFFGDPVTNVKGWANLPFDQVAPSRLGKMLDAKQQSGNHTRPYLRNENVQWDRFDLTEVSVMDFDDGDREEFLLAPGDLIICEGGEPGRCAIWRGELVECYFQKALHRARPIRSKATPEYLLHLLWSLAERGGFRDHVTSSTIAHLTGEKLKRMVVPVPSLPIQQEFVALVKPADRLRQVRREALRQAEHLFQTLLHRAFTTGL